jgi:hypothetical protein
MVKPPRPLADARDSVRVVLSHDREGMVYAQVERHGGESFLIVARDYN